MEVQVTMDSLPCEVLERILSNACITVEDIVRCSLTCKYMNGVCQRNSLWRSKFQLHYPFTYQFLQSKEKKDWKARYITQYGCKKKLVQCILALSRTFVWSMYHDYEWPDIPRRALALYKDLFIDALGESNNYYVLDECHNIINSGNPYMELTLKYYADKLYRHMYEQLVINSKWEEFSASEDCYEEALLWIVVALRPVPQVCNEAAVRDSLDRLAADTLDYIKETYPDNPLSSKVFSKEDLTCKGVVSHWRGEHCAEILKGVHYVVKHKAGFRISNSLCGSEPDHYCVDYVLQHKKGSERLLLIIELCVAKRLGVLTEIRRNVLNEYFFAPWKLFYKGHDGMNANGHACDLCKRDLSFMCVTVVEWKETKVVDAKGMCQTILQLVVFLTECWLKHERWQAGEPMLYNLLDEETYNQPIRLLFTAWQHVEHWKMSRLYHYMNQLLRVTGSDLTQGEILHLSILLRINSRLTLEKLLQFRRQMGQPPNTMRDLLRMLASVDKRARTRVTELKSLLSSGIASYSSLNPLASVPWPHGWPGGEMVQKRRVDRKSWQVQFAVGEVLEQRGGNMCVVYDWDSMCVESEDTLTLMGETGLIYGTDQPFYRVLTDGGSARYLAQENLRHAHQPQHIKNPLIGRYFTAFIYPFYLPNPQKAYEYPEDANIREQNALSLKLKFASSE